jgi:hypothetical protein
MAKRSVQHRVRADCAARPHPAQACCLQRTAACAAVQDRRLCRKTALILAAYHKHAEAVTLLVKAGADQSIKDQEGCAQLHCGVDQALVFASSFHPQTLSLAALILRDPGYLSYAPASPLSGTVHVASSGHPIVDGGARCRKTAKVTAERRGWLKAYDAAAASAAAE